MKNIEIELNDNEANKLSIAIDNMFIENFFEISMALSELYNIESLTEVCHLMIKLKSEIDLALDRK